ncbi:MAG TPA: response regulator, partial [Thermoanaerobaculia bacterium]
MKMADGFPTKILIVDDKETVRESLASRFRLESSLFKVSTAQGGDEALELLKHQWFDVVLCDRVLRHGMDGIAVTREITSRHAGIRVVVFTDKEDHEDTKLHVLRAGAYSYFSKPIHFDELLHGIGTINSVRRTEYLGKSFRTLA